MKKNRVLEDSYLRCALPIQINSRYPRKPLPDCQEQDHRVSFCFSLSLSPSVSTTKALFGPRTNPGKRKRKDTRPQTRDLIYPTVTLAGFNLSLDLAARPARSLHSRTRVDFMKKGGGGERERREPRMVRVVGRGVQLERSSLDRRCCTAAGLL